MDRIFVNDELNATFVCPKCGTSRTANVAKFVAHEKEVRIRCKCKCGHRYPITLERRKNFRKPVNFPGMYYYGPSFSEKGLMTILDLSNHGVKIRLNARPTFSEGDQIRIEFNLDDRERSQVVRDVRIKSIQDRDLGLEFTSPAADNILRTYIFISNR